MAESSTLRLRRDLEARRKALGLARTELALLVGMDLRRLRAAMLGRGNPTARTLDRIECALDVAALAAGTSVDAA